MKLYKVTTQEDDCGYDCYEGHIVACEHSDYCIDTIIASGGVADEGKEAWLRATIQYIGEATEGINHGIILSDFNAG